MDVFCPLEARLTGTHLIEASAGTGKTYTITTLFLRLLVERGLTVDRVLVVTFTEAATAELRGRIRGRLRAALAALDGGEAAGADPEAAAVAARGGEPARVRERLTEAIRGFDEAAVFTIHGFCRRMLQENAFESGVPFETELVADLADLHDEVLRDFWVRELHDAPPLYLRFLHQRGVRPGRLAQLLQRVVGRRDATLLPRAADRGVAGPPADGWASGRAAASAAAAFGGAFEEARAIWSRDRADVEATLANADGLNRNRYRPNSLPGWCARMGDLLRPETPPRPLLGEAFDRFDRFTTSGLADSVRKGGAPPAHPFFDACERLRLAEQALADVYDEETLGLQRWLATWAREEIDRRKRAAATQSFDDLLRQLDEALAGPGGGRLAAVIRERFPAALIDEFQDTDPVQYRIFKAVYGAGPDSAAPTSGADGRGGPTGEPVALFLIGDPKQAIYAFRGADIFTYLNAAADATGGRHTLLHNWRSAPRLVEAVNAMFGRAQTPFLFPQIGFAPATPAAHERPPFQPGSLDPAPLQLRYVPRDERGRARSKAWAADVLPGAVAADVVRLIESGARVGGRPVGAGDVAVLVRTNHQAALVQRALRRLRVPAVLHSQASVFDTEEALEVERLLRAVADPGDVRAVRGALATALLGVDAAALVALQGDEAEWERWLGRFRVWHDRWTGRGFVQMFRSLVDEQDVPARLLSFVDGERRLTNVLHLGELLHSAADGERIGPTGLVRWFALRRVGEEAAGDDAQLRLESDERAVQLVTVHKSKGLEYPVVYCPFLWDGALLRAADQTYVTFHDPDDGHGLKLDLGSADRARHLSLAERESLAEGLRLLYVALTRAEHRCVVFWGPLNQAERSPLAWLLHQPPTAATPATDDADIAALLDATRERVTRLRDEELRSELATLAEATNGAIAVAPLDVSAGRVWNRSAEDRGALTRRTFRRTLDSSWRTSSFSGLKSAGATAADGPADASPDDGWVAADPDEPADAAVEALALDAATAPDLAPGLAPDRPTTSDAAALAAAALVPLRELPGGTEAGQCVHDILETLSDFGEQDVGRLAAHAAGPLAAHGIAERWAEPLAAALVGALATPLDPATPGLTLGALGPTQRLVELPFLFPIAEAGPGALGPETLASVLAAALSEHGGGGLPPDYPARLRRLGFRPFRGFLRGFIDLVFEYGGRYWIVDYKTNVLGDRFRDYTPDRLAVAMTEAHYHLQYLLYLVALHRFLRHRIADYDYDLHVGGVLYLFLRGMAPDAPPSSGVFHARPPRGLVDALSAALTAPAPSAPGAPEHAGARPGGAP